MSEATEAEAKQQAPLPEQSAPAQQAPKAEPAASQEQFEQLMAAFKQRAAQMEELKAQLAAKGKE